MRTILFLRQVAVVVLVAFAANITLPSIEVVFAAEGDPEQNTSSVTALIDEQLQKKAQALAEEKEANENLKKITGLEEKDLEVLLPKLADAAIVLVQQASEPTELANAANVQSIYRVDAAPSAEDFQKRQKEQRQKIGKEIRLAKGAIHKSKSDELAEDLKSKSDTSSIVKSLKRAQTFLVFMAVLSGAFSAFMSRYLMQESDGLNLILNHKDAQGEYSPSRILIDYSLNPDFIDWVMKSDYSPNGMGRALRSSEITEETFRDSLFSRQEIGNQSYIGFDDPIVARRLEFLGHKLQLTNFYKYFSFSGAFLGFAVAAHLGRGIAKQRKKLKKLTEEVKELEAEKIKENKLEEIYERLYWSKWRQVFPEVPHGHAAALAWLDKKIEELSKKLFENPQTVVATPTVSTAPPAETVQAGAESLRALGALVSSLDSMLEEFEASSSQPAKTVPAAKPCVWPLSEEEQKESAAEEEADADAENTEAAAVLRRK